MNKKTMVAWLLGTLVICWLTPLCFSQPENIYHNSEGHFSFTPPSEWSEASQNDLSKLAKAMDQLPGPKVELATAFYNAENTNIYMLIRIEKNGEWPKNRIQKMIPGGMLKQATRDMKDLFKDYAKFKFNEPVYDDNKHILYIKTAAQTGESKILGVAATVLSNYGSVTMAFYAPEENFDTTIISFNQLIDTFTLDEGYQYSGGQKESGVVTKNIQPQRTSPLSLPQCLPAWALFFMSIWLYGKRINWRDLKGSWGYLIKSLVALVLAVIINRFFLHLRATANVSADIEASLELLFTLLIVVFWYWTYKKIKKGLESSKINPS